MKLNQLPSLVLAVVLQLLPMCRLAPINQAAVPSGFAILMRWVAGAGVALGSYDAVSGVSAYVAGLQNLSPVGPLTLSATGTVGQACIYRIIVNNAGQNPLQAFYDATGLPPGLTINTNLAFNGGTNQIKGTPTVAGVFPVTLIAGNSLYTNTVATNVTITIAGNGTGTAPSLTTQPADVTVTSGGSASFWVVAGGSSPLNYQWRKDGTNLLGATGATNKLASATTNDAGGYSVVVTNAHGAITSRVATLTVTTPITPPQISSPPTNLTVVAGQPAAFFVTATGTAPLAYQWRFNVSPLADATNASLALNPARLAQAGDYSVVVTNSGGSVTSAPAHLAIDLPAPPMVNLLPAQGTDFVLTFIPVVGLTNSVQTAATLNGGPWTVLTNIPPPAVANSVSVTDKISGAASFYRVSVSP